jgi:ABC-type uncharacterized transport system permease subunit
MRTQTEDFTDVMVLLPTVAIGLGVAGGLFLVPSVTLHAAIVAGVFASSMSIFVLFVGTIGWAVYAATCSDGASREDDTLDEHDRRFGRSGAA